MCQLFIQRFREGVACLLLFVSMSATGQDGEFSLVKKNDQYKIFIYERWITFPESKPPYKAREVKGDFTVKCTVLEALRLIQDEKKIKLWQDHVSEFKVYRSKDTTYWEEYSYHDIPWPVSDQDHFLRYKIDPQSTSEKMFITFQSKVDDKLAPVREDVTRMVLSGSWSFEKTGPEKVKVSYRILSKPIGIPRIFTDPVIRSNIVSTIKSYIDVLEDREK